MSAPAFTDRDVEKAVSGATKGGFAIGRIEIDRNSGRICLFAAGDNSAQEQRELEDELAAWIEDDRRNSQGRVQGHRKGA